MLFATFPLIGITKRFKESNFHLGKDIEPILIIELPKNIKELTSLIGDPQGNFANLNQSVNPAGAATFTDNRTLIVKSLYWDYLFILIYWSLYCAMSVLLYRLFQGARPYNYIAIISIIFATLTALFDIVENRYIHALIDNAVIDAGLIAKEILFSKIKWLCSFITTLLLSVIYLKNHNWAIKFIGAGYLLIVLLGVVGTIDLDYRILLVISFTKLFPLQFLVSLILFAGLLIERLEQKFVAGYSVPSQAT